MVHDSVEVHIYRRKIKGLAFRFFTIFAYMLIWKSLSFIEKLHTTL